VSCVFVGVSGGPVALVDHAAEESSSLDSVVKVDHHGRIVFGRMLVMALVWPALVEVLFIFA
jgi:hypothetical protein